MQQQMRAAAQRFSGKILGIIKAGKLDAQLQMLQGWQQVAICWSIEIALQKESDWTLTGTSLAEAIVIEHFHKVERYGASAYPLSEKQRKIVVEFYNDQVRRAG